MVSRVGEWGTQEGHTTIHHNASTGGHGGRTSQGGLGGGGGESPRHPPKSRISQVMFLVTVSDARDCYDGLVYCRMVPLALLVHHRVFTEVYFS